MITQQKAKKTKQTKKKDDAPAAPAATRTRSRRSGPSSSEPAAVNLLSPWVLEELHVSRLRKRFAAGAVALVVALGLGWTGLTLKLHQVEEEVRGEEAVASGLSRQIADLGDVRAYVAAVEQRSTAVEAVTGAEVEFSRALTALDAALPRRAAFESLTVALPTTTGEGEDAEATCPGPDPFGAVPVVACLSLTGTADSRDDVSTLVLELDSNPLFVEPFVATTTRGSEPGVSFTGTVGLTDAVLAVDPAADDDGEDADEAAARAEEGGR